MKLNNLQILRGISALLVCCFHFADYINFQDLRLGEILFSKGSIGVNIFFVISGFIITFTTYKKKFTANQSSELTLFYKRRIIRIIPLYFILTLAWMVLGGNFMSYFHGEGAKRLIHSVFFLPQKDTFPVLYLGWSLNYEMFFYLIFGISLLFNTKKYSFIVLFFIFTYILGIIYPFEGAYLQLVTSSLNLYFVMGILLAVFFNRFTVNKSRASFISIIGVSFFLLYLFGFLKITNPLITLMVVSLLVFSFLLFDFTFHYKGNRFLIFLGDISYSLYLSHPFVEIFFRKFKVAGYFNIPYFIFKILVVIAVAAFLYHFVEKKITHYLKIKLKA